jgi:hypothetical protein
MAVRLSYDPPYVQQSYLTYAYPGALPKRKVAELRPFLLALFAEALRVEPLRVRVVLGVVMERHGRNQKPNSFLHPYVCSAEYRGFCALSPDQYDGRVFTQSFCRSRVTTLLIAQ